MRTQILVKQPSLRQISHELRSTSFYGEKTYFVAATFNGEETSFSKAEFSSQETAFIDATFNSVREATATASHEEARRREENRGGWLSWYRRLEHGYLERAAECGRRADALEIPSATELKGVTK